MATFEEIRPVGPMFEIGHVIMIGAVLKDIRPHLRSIGLHGNVLLDDLGEVECFGLRLVDNSKFVMGVHLSSPQVTQIDTNALDRSPRESMELLIKNLGLIVDESEIYVSDAEYELNKGGQLRFHGD